MQIYSPAITVVIPVYNRKATIKYCLESVLRQSVSPSEIIVVDDCSTDNTVDLVRSFPDPRIRCLVQDGNYGAQAARNRGIRESSSDWIAFLDSDDEWVPDKLEKQISVLESINFDPMTVIHSDYYRYDHVTGATYPCQLSLVDGTNVHHKLLNSFGPMFQGMLTSKTALENIGFLDELVPSYQEWDTAIRLAKECRYIHIREALFIYHLHSGETISKNTLNDVTGYQYILDKHRLDIIKHCGAKTLNRHLITNAQKAISWGYFSEAREILLNTVGRSATVVLLEWMVKREMIVNMRVKSNVAVRIMRMVMAYCDKFLHEGITALFESRPLTRHGER